jgi:hypothetical protein
MALNLSHFKGFTIDDYPMLTEWLHRYNRTFARFYESPLRLMHQPHVFKWGIVEDCLCIIKKRSIMGTPVCYLIIPPIGDKWVEVMLMFAQESITTLLSDEENRDEWETIPDKGNAEYVYRLDAFSDRYGVNKNQLRRPCNHALRQIESGAIDIRLYRGGVEGEVIDSACLLTRRWLKQRDKKAWKQTFFVENFNAVARHAPDNHLAVFIMQGDRCLGYLITERTANGIINNTACVDYEDNIVKEPTLILLHYAAKRWADDGEHSGTPVNRGAAVRGAGSIKAKEKLRPIGAKQMHKLVVEKLTKEKYESFWLPPPSPVEWL